MDALVEDAAQLFVTLDDQDAVRTRFFCGDSCGKTGGASADNDDIIGIPCSHYCAPPFVLSRTIFESPPSLVIFSMAIPSSLLMISIERGEQKPA